MLDHIRIPAGTNLSRCSPDYPCQFITGQVRGVVRSVKLSGHCTAPNAMGAASSTYALTISGNVQTTTSKPDWAHLLVTAPDMSATSASIPRSRLGGFAAPPHYATCDQYELPAAYEVVDAPVPPTYQDDYALTRDEPGRGVLFVELREREADAILNALIILAGFSFAVAVGFVPVWLTSCAELRHLRRGSKGAKKVDRRAERGLKATFGGSKGRCFRVQASTTAGYTTPIIKELPP